MLPRKITANQSAHERAKWNVVRLDTYQPLPGTIVSADADSGDCQMEVVTGREKQEDGSVKVTMGKQDYSLGANGLAIIGRK